jgi:hypothetical protein
MDKFNQAIKLLYDIYKDEKEIALIKNAEKDKDYVFVNRALQTLIGNIHRLKVDLILEHDEYCDRDKK